MSYKIDKELQEGMDLLKEEKKIDSALKLINHSARKGTTKGKSFFEVGRIIRTGVPGLEANPEESRRYYDAAMNHFRHEPCDSMDYREMGDYYYYGLGTDAVNLNRALEYYDMAAKDDDELALQRATEIRETMKRGSATSAPALSPESALHEDMIVSSTEKEETTPANAVAEELVAEDKETVQETVYEPQVTVSPVVSSESKPVVTDNKIVNEIISADQLLIRAIRLLDSDVSSEQDKLDGLELAKAAADEGSLRANILLGYIYEGENALVEGNYDLSRKYYETAISLGSATAMYRLGKLYLEPDSPFYDDQVGHKLIEDSARKGYVFALCAIGDAFRIKVVDPRNLDIAYRYYALAGERGLGLGFHNMAEIDASRQHIDLAHEHEKLAADNGYDPEIGNQDPLFYSLHI